MGIGTGLFLGFVFLGMVALYLKTRDRWNWRHILCYPILAIVGISTVIVVGYGVKYAVDNRVQPLTQFSGIKLTDTREDVKFKKGMPAEVSQNGEVWEYKDEGGNLLLRVSFRGEKLRIVFYGGDCAYCDNFFGLGIGSAYDDVIAKLGQPSFTDTSPDSLMRISSYEKWNLIFYFTQGKVIGFGMYNPALGPVKFKKVD